MPTRRRIIVGITGASGAIYAKRLIETLVATDIHVHLVVSTLGRRLLNDELDIRELDLDLLAGKPNGREHISLLPYNDVGAAIASGSYQTEGMVVIPCSNNKLAELAHGLGENLISRAAQVVLKERRKLIIVHREMPLGMIELKNLLALAEAGAIICPANPGFYHRPQTADDLVNMVVGRVADLLNVPHALHPRWCGKAESSTEI
ncbi:MAG: UbiX family flavin prenyltransferase [Phycisphaerae bacterium]